MSLSPVEWTKIVNLWASNWAYLMLKLPVCVRTRLLRVFRRFTREWLKSGFRSSFEVRLNFDLQTVRCLPHLRRSERMLLDVWNLNFGCNWICLMQLDEHSDRMRLEFKLLHYVWGFVFWYIRMYLDASVLFHFDEQTPATQDSTLNPTLAFWVTIYKSSGSIKWMRIYAHDVRSGFR